MTQIICTLTGKTFSVKKHVKKHIEMPACAEYWLTTFNYNLPYPIKIYRTPNGILYAKNSPI